MKKPTEPKRNVHFRLKPEEYKIVQQAAKAEERSAAYFVTRLVRAWLNKHKGSNNDECMG